MMHWIQDGSRARRAATRIALAAPVAALLALLSACGRGTQPVQAASAAETTVGVTKVARKSLDRQLTLSSELVPFQEIDVYAKESGYVRKLLVDYGSRVKQGQLLAVLEIPELEAQLRQDDAMTRNATDRVTRATHELNRVEAQHKVLHLHYSRLAAVATSKPGLVAQQEVDDAQGKDLAAEAAVESARANLEAVRSDLLSAQAKHEHDQVLLDYSRITAPFAGVVTQRLANLGTLVQAGTNSSTQALPIVHLAQDHLFRLVIPVPETYVRFIHIGDPVQVTVPSLGRQYTGRFARVSSDVTEQTRTMHTEVDIPNADHTLVAGLYAEALLHVERRGDVLALPLQAVRRANERASVWVVDTSNHVQPRDVQLGLQTDSDTEIVSGLADGDTVVVSDVSGLRPGQAVNPRPVEPMQFHGAGQR
jgi:RND family efflux transporter MFP subunit